MIETILRISVSTGLTVLILMLFFLGVKQRYAAKLKYWVWLLLALRLLVPVTVTLPEAVGRIPVVRQATQAQIVIMGRLSGTEAAAVEQQEENLSPPADRGETETKTPVTGASVPVIIWAVGAGVFLGYHFLVNLAFRRYVRRWGRSVKNPEVRALVARARKNAGIRQPLRVLVLKEAGSPMVMGLWRPTLILPQEDWDATELYYVLRHEMTHLKRRDILYKTILLLCNGIHWFNPLIWMLRARAYQDLEIACDMEVVDGATQTVRMQYCETIMATAQRNALRGFGMATTFGSTKKSIMERFREIFSADNRKKGILVLSVVILVVVLCGATVAVDAALEPSAGAEGSRTEESGAAVTMRNDYFSPVITVPESAKDYILADNPDYVFYCVKDQVLLWGVSCMKTAEVYETYDREFAVDMEYFIVEALAPDVYMIGRDTSDNVWLLTVFCAGNVPESQNIISWFLTDNGIEANPYCITPYYSAEGAEEAAQQHLDVTDPERIYAAAMVRMEAVNSRGFDQEILEAFAAFLSKNTLQYEWMYDPGLQWELGYDASGQIILAAYGDLGDGNHYYSLWYRNGEVVFGINRWYMDYEVTIDEIKEIVS